MDIIVAENIKKEIRIDEDKDVNLVIGKNSEVKIIDTSKSNVKIIVNENAKVIYITIKTDDTSSNKLAIVGKDAVINWVECCIGDKINAVVRTELTGEGSETKTMSVIFGDKDNILNIKNEVVHMASNSKSNMLTRVVLNDRARANYNGLVRVNPNASGCQGYQRKETILLSEDAKIDAVPNLEIENNDVKCSHGATISQIDSEKLFYLMSRGINERDAKKSIVEGFFDPILSVVDEILREEIKGKISDRMEGI